MQILNQLAVTKQQPCNCAWLHYQPDCLKLKGISDSPLGRRLCKTGGQEGCCWIKTALLTTLEALRGMSEIQSGSTGKEFPNIDLILSSRVGRYFCEIDRDYIVDKFNLTGFTQDLPDFERCYRSLLSPTPTLAAKEDDSVFCELVQAYGMIHNRFIMTSAGVQSMQRKFINGAFGFCPRYHCRRQNFLPVGLSSVLGDECVVMYCANCEDIFRFPQSIFLDGAFYGTSFPLFFLLSFPEFIPKSRGVNYVPKVFGFQLKENDMQIE